MKLVVPSRRRSLYSTRRLGLVGMARGHEVRVVDPWRCAVELDNGRSRVFANGEPLPTPDALVARVGATNSGHALAVLRQIEQDGAYCLNRAEPTARAHDKLRTLQILASRGVPIVPTCLVRAGSDVRDAVERLGGPPCIVKFSDGALGAGVMLLDSAASAASVVEALAAARRHALLQPFLPHACDERFFVVGRKVVAAMRRWTAEGEFRANIHQGARAEGFAPDEARRRLAVEAARALGLEMAGVDVLDSPDGPRVLEVNASPGLEGIERASGRNVAGALVRFLESAVAAARETPADAAAPGA